jgi:hypothetical protein
VINIYEGIDYKNTFYFLLFTFYFLLFTFYQNNPATDPENVQKLFLCILQPLRGIKHKVTLSVDNKRCSTRLFISANGFVYYTGVKSVSQRHYSSLQNLDPKYHSTLYQHTASS